MENLKQEEIKNISSIDILKNDKNNDNKNIYEKENIIDPIKELEQIKLSNIKQY